MPQDMKFPPTVEIKRVIAAAIRAGVEIGSIEIHPRKITIRPREENAPQISDYDIWKMSEGRDSSRIRHRDEDSDTLPKETKG